MRLEPAKKLLNEQHFDFSHVTLLTFFHLNCILKMFTSIISHMHFSNFIYSGFTKQPNPTFLPFDVCFPHELSSKQLPDLYWLRLSAVQSNTDGGSELIPPPTLTIMVERPDTPTRQPMPVL